MPLKRVKNYLIKSLVQHYKFGNYIYNKLLLNLEVISRLPRWTKYKLPELPAVVIKRYRFEKGNITINFL